MEYSENQENILKGVMSVIYFICSINMFVHVLYTFLKMFLSYLSLFFSHCFILFCSFISVNWSKAATLQSSVITNLYQ